MKPKPQSTCPDCDASVDRRTFVRAVGGAAMLGAISSGWHVAHAAPSAQSAAESAVARFHASLSDAQKKEVAFGFDHELRKKVNANWHITKPTIGDKFYSDDQRKIIHEIIRNVTSEDGYKRFEEQTEYDDGGFNSYSVALFGEPGSGKCQWELTGRHLTLRADGNSVDKAAFGGPIVYGHGEEDAKSNVFYYQTQKVNEVFKALDAKQAEHALIATAPNEAAVKIQGDQGKFPGVAVGELSSDQKTLVEATLKVLLAPYRKEDVDEVFETLKTSGGLDKLHLAFYQQGDLGQNKEWDIWRVEGPSFVWHFRGAPHVHAYINIGSIG